MTRSAIHEPTPEPFDLSGPGSVTSVAERALFHAYRNAAYRFPKLREPCVCGGMIVSQNTWKDIRAAVNRHAMTDQHRDWRNKLDD